MSRDKRAQAVNRKLRIEQYQSFISRHPNDWESRLPEMLCEFGWTLSVYTTTHHDMLREGFIKRPNEDLPFKEVLEKEAERRQQHPEEYAEAERQEEKKKERWRKSELEIGPIFVMQYKFKCGCCFRWCLP